MRYIAFLRGINVGGKNKVSMPDLKELFEKNGFLHVVTYINSGNILFSSDRSLQEETLASMFEQLILTMLQLQISVVILSADSLRSALDHAPDWWGRDEDTKHNAILVIPPATAEDIYREVGVAKPEYEKVDYHGRVIFWSAPLVTFSRTRWSKVVGSPLYAKITIRNENTMRKLLLLVEAE